MSDRMQGELFYGVILLAMIFAFFVVLSPSGKNGKDKTTTACTTGFVTKCINAINSSFKTDQNGCIYSDDGKLCGSYQIQ